MGGALEDGAHRAAGLGACRRRTTSSVASFPGSPTRRQTPTVSSSSSRRRARFAARAISLSVALQYGNAFLQGYQAAALKPADFFGNDDVLYLMEDMATGEIRLSILWEWLHKGARLTDADARDGRRGSGDVFSADLLRARARRGIREAARRRRARTSTTIPRRRRCRSRATS